MKPKIFLLASAVLLVLIEVSLRLYGFGDPPIVILDENVEYYLTPNTNYSRFNNTIRINRYGMRAEEFDREKINDKRVFILGDSVVYGTHLLDQNEIVAYQLARMLPEQANEVYSIAASSWGPGNILAYLEKFGPFAGETAVIVQSSHDRQDIPFESNNITPYRTKPSVTAIGDVIEAIFQRYIKGHHSPGIAPTDFSSRRAQASKSLSELISLLKLNFKNVVLVHHATRDELSHKESENSNALYYEETAKQLNITFSPSTPFYNTYCSPNEIYRDQIHLSTIGATCLAELIYTALEPSQVH